MRLSQHEIPKNIWIILVARQKVLKGEFEYMRKLFVGLVSNYAKKD